MSYPDDRKYADSHEWVLAEGETALIGISAYAAGELGELVYIELPEVGEEIEVGAEFGVVESVKAASDLVAPVSGEIVEVNDAAVDEPKTVNDDPYDAGWLVRVRLSDPGELDDLHNAGSYEEMIGED
ncbi:MAG: glycine cleavage system protein GcvH [Candidatus Coatesbacteria bacterium]|nr:glycine cleavage system protein GcvH [Candidatus Coatesbacteria bacterium]